jgi:Fe-S cluster assembly protein SufD
MPVKTQDMDKNDWYLSAFARFENSLNGEAQTPLHQKRRAALERFAMLGLPTPRDEDWNYTNVAPILRHDFEPVGSQAVADTDANAIAPYLFDGEGARLVLVDGHYAAHLSQTDGLPDGVQIQSLRRLLADDPEALNDRLFELVDTDTQGFAALNGAFLRDGAVIRLAEGAQVEAPIHVLSLVSGGGAVFGRTLLIAGAGSRATLVETHAGPDTAPYLDNAATEIWVGDSAQIDHIKVQREGAQGYHIGALGVHQADNCRFTSTCVTLSGKLVRNDLHSRLDGERVDSTLNGLYVLDGEEHADNHTLIEHIQPNCSSHEFYKGILDAGSTGAFRGKIHVHQAAQKTDAFQSNQNLLLSDRAEVFTQPQLEIYADDVKCSHGATIGQLNDEALFYLRARGLPADTARHLLTHAFALEVLERIRVDGLRTDLERLVVEKLERGLVQDNRP